MQFFDANCFLGQPPSPVLRSFNTAAELLEEMDDIGIERAVVCHAAAQMPGSDGNRRLMNEVRNRKRLLPCWIVHPQFFNGRREISECLSEFRGEGIRMVRLQPGPLNRYSLHPWAFGEFFDGLASADIALYVEILVRHGFDHSGIPEHEWPILHEMAGRHPALNIILFGKKLSVSKAQLFGLMRARKNVCVDTSAFQTWRATEILCENIGADRLVFGSYMPHFDAAQFVTQVQYAAISEEDRKKIASGNLSKKLGMT